jgi:tRNA acetyltransferase TAN1
LTEAR